ncbi:MAG: TetR family transcriptional regulator [Propionibacteriales bacterium]|nr:TetR family transcriptional regulator [Propionibacteriales bacterium]
MSSTETRAALMAATIRLVGTAGVRAVTARSVASEAGVNQALVFYHFDGVDGLLREAFTQATREMVSQYGADLEAAESFADLHAVGIRLAADTAANGSAAVLANVIASAQTDPEQARLLSETLGLWRSAVEHSVRRVLDRYDIDDTVDAKALTATLSAAVVGILLMDSIDGAPTTDALGSIAWLARLADRLGKVVPATVKRRMLRQSR